MCTCVWVCWNGFVAFQSCILRCLLLVLGYPAHKHAHGIQHGLGWSRYNSTTPKTLETVRKPVLNTMALLSLLGTRIYTADGLEPSLVGNVGVLPTTAQGPGTSLVISALVWYAHDSEPINPDAPLQNVALELQNVPFTAADEAVTAVFALDETHGNSYSVYVQQGKPMFPSPAQLKVKMLTWQGTPPFRHAPFDRAPLTMTFAAGFPVFLLDVVYWIT